MSKKARKQFSVLVYWCLQDMSFIVYFSSELCYLHLQANILTVSCTFISGLWLHVLASMISE